MCVVGRSECLPSCSRAGVWMRWSYWATQVMLLLVSQCTLQACACLESVLVLYSVESAILPKALMGWEGEATCS